LAVCSKQLKAFLLTALLIGTILPAQAQDKPPFETAQGISRAVQKYTGISLLTNVVLSSTASVLLSARLRTLVKAKIKTYSFTDLLDGEFKSIDIKLNGGRFEGVPLGKIHGHTTNPFKVRYFKSGGKQAGLECPVMINIDGALSERAISRALNSRKVASGLRFMKLDLPGLGEQTLQVLHPEVEVIGDQLKVNAWLITEGASKETGIPLEVIATPVLEKERYIMLREMKVKSTAIENPEAFADFVSKLLNPLIDFGRMDRKTHAVRLQKLQVKNGRVTFAARLLLAPPPSQASAASPR